MKKLQEKNFTRLLMILAIVLLPTTSFLQTGVKGFVGAFQGIHTDNFMEARAELGIIFPKSIGSLSLLLAYSYNGNLEMTHQGEKIPLYTMNSHFLGLGFKHRIFGEDAFYSPSIKFLVQTEVATNYRGGYLENLHDYRPIITFEGKENENVGMSYLLHYYIFSPFLLKLTVGNEFYIGKGVSLELGLGYATRAFKTGWVSWNSLDGKGADDVPDRKLSKSFSFAELRWQHLFDLSLGVRYTFPWKNKEN